MKKFIRIVISYVMVLVFISLAINAVYVKMSKTDSDNTEKFSDMPNNIQVCNTGSSHGLYGFNYENHSEVACFNFGLVSQRLSYDYRLLYNYQDNLAEGCVVFIPISYFSFLGKDEVDGEDFESKNQRYYKILPSNLIKEYDRTVYFYNKFPALSAGGGSILRTFAGKGLDHEGIHAKWEQTADDIDLTANVEAAYERHLVKNKLDESGRYILRQEDLDAVYDIITLCNKNGWKPILVTMPFLEEYSSLAYERSSDYLEIFYELINDIVEDTGVEYYDYSLDDRFSTRHDWFMNGDHLNKEGAKQFTDVLFEEILTDNNR